TLTASTTGGSAGRALALSGTWQRISMPVNLGQSTVSVMFGAQLDAGASVDLFGMQVEAQLTASDYKMTGTQGGVYSSARFAADELTATAQSRDVYDAVIRMVEL